MGVSGFVSVGNTVDLTPNDLLLYWDEDPGTDVVLAYLESVPDPRRFARIARRISRHKPIVAVKAAPYRCRAPGGILAHRCAGSRGDRGGGTVPPGRNWMSSATSSATS